MPLAPSPSVPIIAPSIASPWRARWVHVYRCVVMVLIAVLVREHHAAVKPSVAKVGELSEFYPAAAYLKAAETPAGGIEVFDAQDARIGRVVLTMPDCKRIIGYSGTTDALIALDEDERILGVTIRSSEDTARYVDDVKRDRLFLKSWDGMSMRKASKLGVDGSGIDAVSGATATSRAVSRSVAHRLALAQGQTPPARTIRYNWRDVGLAAVIACACLMAFTRLRGMRWARRGFQVIVIVYIGFLNGDLLSIKLLAGWTLSGVPWDLAPGMGLLAAAAILIPWTTRQPLYCHQLCPHGAMQEWVFQITRGRFRIHLPKRVAAMLRTVPAVLLGMALVVAMLRWKFDLSKLEPFDAYGAFLSSIGWIALVIGVVGLIASACVPMAYCKFGCPTGALLEYARWGGAQDRFGRRDVAAAILLGLAAGLYFI